MNVVPMARYRSRETVELLEALASKARQGCIVGLAICYLPAEGEEQILTTGAYRASSDKAAAAFLRMSMELARSRGEYESQRF